jgi:hypothetical protein
MSESQKPEKSVTPNAETAHEDGAVRKQPEEIGGRGGLDPTRYGDWEKNGRCIDF